MPLLRQTDRKILKKCARPDCARLQPLSAFHKNKQKKDGLNPYCRECVRKLHKGYRDANPEATALKSRKGYLKLFYGITLEQYEEMLALQNESCAICGTHHTFFEKSLHVDHCHLTGKIRQLLCNNCNHVIGKARDDIRILKNAIQYLTKHRVNTVNPIYVKRGPD